ncbi:MAG: PilZ domain-containing protein [Candidatus Omnitrophota bacterium]
MSRPDIERRKFIRLDSIFPIEFQILDQNDSPLSSWLQGFTNNISKGGISLVINNVSSDLEEIINNKKDIKISLKINIPLSAKTTEAIASIAWIKKIKDDLPNQYNIGLQYEKLNSKDNKRIIRYARFKRWFPIVTITTVIVFLIISLLMGYINSKLIKGNIGLVEELVSILQNSIVAKQKIKTIRRQRTDLQTRLSEIKIKINNLNESLSTIKDEDAVGIHKQINEFEKEKTDIEKTLFDIALRENVVAEEVLVIDEKIPAITRENLDKIYQWLENHQNQKTGLVATYEAGTETSLWASLYEQALSIFTYDYFGDYKYSQKMLEFFYEKAKRSRGLFYDVYSANSGEVIKSQVDVKSNIWLGMAILDYVFRTHDERYLVLAKQIADNLHYFKIEAQKPIAIEYVFFKMLYTLTQDKVYLPDENIIQEIKKQDLINSEELVVLLLGVSPDKLSEFGLNAEDMIGFIEDNYNVVSYHQRSKTDVVPMQGFSFEKDDLISIHVTAQIVLIYKIIAKYYSNKGNSYKARLYQDKADEYLAEIGKVIFSSPCNIDQGQGCLPTTNTILSKATTKPHISISATIYTLFAYYGYDLATLNEK